MGRPRKNAVVEGIELKQVEVPTELVGFSQVVEADELSHISETTVFPMKKDSYTLSAMFLARDEDNAKVKLVYRGSGHSVAEALENLQDDDSNPYPLNINALVTLKVKKNDKEIERTLAPHKARAILQHKNLEAFNAVFRGI